MSSVLTIRKFIIILILVLSFNTSVFASDGDQVYIENISYENKDILIRFSDKIPFELIQVDERQFLLAVKGIVPETLNNMLKDAGFVSKISFDKMPGNVTAIVFYTKEEIKGMDSAWLVEGRSLLIKVTS